MNKWQVLGELFLGLPKNEDALIIYSPLCLSKPAWLSLIFEMQMKNEPGLIN